MGEVAELSDELAEEHGVEEPEMFGFLALLEQYGLDEAAAREAAQREFGGDTDG